MKEEKISMYRVASMVGMFISTILATGLLCYLNKLNSSQVISVIFVVLAFFPMIIFNLMFERRRELIANNEQTTYRRILIGFMICCIIMVAVSFMPAFMRPVILFPIIMSAYSNDSLGIIIGMFFNVLLCFTTGNNFYELIAYVLLVMVGGMLVKALKQVEYRLYIGLVFLFSSVLFPNLCAYFTNQTLGFTNLILGMLNGLLVAMYAIAFFPNTRERTMREKHYYYGDILSDDFVQVKWVHDNLPSEYSHARRVSEIAYKYAFQLELDSDLAAAAGFYYHLGKWQGNPPIENAVKRANELCFPNELIQILKEYNATDDLPSTPESALVHIIDGLLIKIENADSQVRTSQWNKDVLIHQTLNEFSSAGYYDHSGLSINSFIRIREWLAKEELLQ